MVDSYYRKIEDVRNDIENSIQISSILLKLVEYDEKLSDLSKIGNTENNISSHLGKITTNEGAISSNLGKIDSSITAIKLINKNSQNNKTNISSNLNQINDIKFILPTLEILKKHIVFFYYFFYLKLHQNT